MIFNGIASSMRLSLFSFQLPDIRGFIQSVHNFRGLPRIAGMGMKSSGYVTDNAY